ncbi:hypothetical protein BJ138DRAFT_1061722 [Hygrophoropsis aurantiaca]|uniref:Uncharacterized protein n=1 Tax=Hygrophoropsis aurantiaca TaxID=72124 RepID=A0ACB8AFT7_9AGAM|nr:hypothetical protein BJ138DRAFT_1061722 [Hygrophoropsis aurantiaca]
MPLTAAAFPEDSRPSTPAGTPNAQPPAKKRKQAGAGVVSESSPAPADPNNPTATANVVLPARHDFFSRPRLTISRFPTFPDNGGQYYTTEQLAMNRIGFRYIPAGVAPPGSAFPCRTIESTPQSYRVSWEDRSPFVRVTPDGLGLAGGKGFRSARCNAPIREGKWYIEVRIEDGGGERAADAPDVNSREGSHVRLGWARREAPLNGPVGLDAYSYGYRDKTGEKVTLSRPRPYGRPYRTGDVIGMYISLPARRTADADDPHDPARIHRERIAIEFKGQEYFESLEYAQSKEMAALMDFSNKSINTASLPSAPLNKKSAAGKNLPERGGRPTAGTETPALRSLPILAGSHLAFFVNGECQGAAFNDLYDYLPLRTTSASRKKDKESSKKRAREGAPREHKENPFDDGTLGYYPFISLFNHARVQINPGPDFAYPPPADIEGILSGVKESQPVERTWRPICERYPEYMQEQWDIDSQEEQEAKVEVAKLAELDKIEAAKKAQKESRKVQADARKKAKKEAEQRAASALDVREASVASAREQSIVSARESSMARDSPAVRDDRFGPSVSLPTLHLSAYDGEQPYSPAPTVDSNAGYPPPAPETESGYNSEVVMEDQDGEEHSYEDFPMEDEEDVRHHSPQTQLEFPPEIDIHLEELL